MAEQQTSETETTETTETTDTTETSHPKGSVEALRADLARERDERQAAQREAREAKALKAELETLKASTQTETEKAIDAAKREARAEAIAEVTRDRAQDRIRAAAGTKLQDAEDAVAHLNPDDFISDGQIDSQAITKAIDKLVKDKPYLAAKSPRPSGDADLGARGSEAEGDPNAWFGDAIRKVSS